MYTKKQTTKNERCYSLTGKFLNFRNDWGHLLEEKDMTRHVFMSERRCDSAKTMLDGINSTVCVLFKTCLM